MRPRVIFPAIMLGSALVLVLCAVLAAPRAARAQSPYVKGLELYRQGRYGEAATVLRAGLPKPPDPAAALSPNLSKPAPPKEDADSPHVRAVLGFTLLRQNSLPEAEEQFDLVRNDPAMECVGLLGAGWTSFARGRTSAAVDLFAEALSRSAAQAGALPDMLRDSVPTDARLALGLIALGRGRAPEALKQLEAAKTGLDVLGSPKELFLALGEARAQNANAQGALDAWAEVPRRESRFPGDASRDELARLKAARIYEAGGDGATALSLYGALAGGEYYKAESLLGQARVLLTQGRKAEALPVLRRLVTQDPNMAGAFEKTISGDAQLRPVLKDWGLAYFHRADYADALPKLTRYLDEVDPNDAACHMGAGWSNLRLGQADKARDAFTEAIRLRPNAADPLAGLAAATMALGKPEEARELLDRALSLDPKNAIALGTRGHLQLSRGDAQQALESFRAALKSRPDYVDSRLSVARILFDRAEYDAAAAEFFRLVTQERRSTTGWNGLGWARLRLNQYDDALAAFAEARRLNPNLPVGAYGMGITLARMGKADQASQRLAEAIYLNPDFAATPEVLDLMHNRPEYVELYLEMGEAYARKLYPTTAAPYLEEYLRQSPNSRPGRRALAWASFWAGQEDKAHALFQTLITVNKDDPDAHLGDGLALLSRGHLDMAEPHLRDAVRLEPSNALAWRALVLLLTRQGRQQEAVAAQREAPLSRNERLDRMSASGFTALSEGRMHDALRDFRRAIALDASLAAPHYGLAFALVELGDAQQARDQLLAGMNLDPAYLDEQELSRLLAQHPELSALAADLSWSQLYALNLPAARSGFERILGTSPGNMGALFGLGATAYLQADWALAESCFDKLLPRAPLTSPSWDKWSHLMDKLGWSAYHQQKYDKALHAFDWLRTLHPETPYAAALGGMGWALIGKGQPRQAQVLFSRALDIFPRNLTAVQGMLALKRAPEGEEDDMDDAPEPEVRSHSRKGKQAKVRAAKASRADDGDERPAKKSKKSRKKADEDDGDAPAKVKKSKKSKNAEAVDEPAKKKSKKGDGDEPKKSRKSKKKKAEQ
jgi:tetratricopeptide (TPR) repeat protein